MTCAAVSHSNEHIRRELTARAGEGTWKSLPAAPSGPEPDDVGYVDYTVWSPAWEQALDVRDVNPKLLTPAVRQALCEHWPEDYGDLENWELDGGPHMDRLARELLTFGFGDDARTPQPRRAISAIENLTW